MGQVTVEICEEVGDLIALYFYVKFVVSFSVESFDDQAVLVSLVDLDPVEAVT